MAKSQEVGRRSTTKSEEEWRKLVEKFEKSEESVREFCKKENIAVKPFYYWRRRIGALAPASFHEESAAPLFKKYELPPPSAVAPVAQKAEYEVRLGNGRSIVIRGAFEREVLVALITAMEG